ncbi:unnamed protein product [Penicillium pancosmium]
MTVRGMSNERSILFDTPFNLSSSQVDETCTIRNGLPGSVLDVGTSGLMGNTASCPNKTSMELTRLDH